MSAMKDIIANITNYAISPANILGAVLDLIEERLDGNHTISDPSNPFLLAIEAATVGPAGHIVYTDTVASNLYKILAVDEEDLYRHLSGPEYIGRWATPAISSVRILINYELILKGAIPLFNDPTIRKVTIPDGSCFYINNIPLSLPAPVDILVYPHDNLRVLFDSSAVTPLYAIKSNIVPNRLVLLDNVRYLELTPPLMQTKVNSVTIPLESSLTLNYDVKFDNQFAHCRVYLDLNNGKWSEILTTHSNMVYDSLKITAILKVSSGQINVEIPLVYQTTMDLGRAIRIDVYSTRGGINEDLITLTSNSVVVTLQDFNSYNNSKYFRAFANIGDIKYYPYQNLNGGTNGLSFEQLKERVVYNVGNSSTPIRPSDITILLKEKGYNSVKIIDNLTDRVYLASSPLSTFTKNGLTLDSLATAIEIMFTEEQATNNFSKTMVKHNSGRTTVLTSAIYKVSGSHVGYLNDSDINYLNSLNGVELCNVLNESLYLFSPFHYSLDSTQVTFKARAYWLEVPTIVGKDFIDSNKNTDFAIGTIESTLELEGGFYKLVLIANTPNNQSNVRCQIRSKDLNLGTSLYLDGEVKKNVNSTTFTFKLKTSFDVDQNDSIEISNLKNEYNINVPTFLKLSTSFDVFYIIENSNSGLTSVFDNEWCRVFYTVPVISATYEKINVKFGEPLTRLYVDSRDSLKPQTWLKYEEPVPLVYSEDVFDRVNGMLKHTVNENNEVVLEILYHKGDVVHDEEDEPVYLHRVGDLVLNGEGKPIPKDRKNVSTLKYVTTTLFSYKYKRTTTPSDRLYYNNMGASIANVLSGDIAAFAGQLLERTNLFFKPQNVVTPVKLGIGSGETTVTSTLLEFNIVFYLTSDGLNNEMVLNNIINTTRIVISKHIKNKTISIPDIESDIVNAKLFSVISFEIEKFIGGKYQMLTILDDETSFNIKDNISLRADGLLEVNNNVNITFKQAY